MRRQIGRVEAYLQGLGDPTQAEGSPVLFFNASTRIQHPSLNAAYSLLASWAVRAGGAPVRYLVCDHGMDLCVLGTKRDDATASPPCRPCVRRSASFFPAALRVPLPYEPSAGDEARREIARMGLRELVAWEHEGLPLGELCLPGLRWALRRNRLPDDEATAGLFRRYLVSAASLARRFEETFRTTRPRRLVVFNGITYPEAIAREVAIRRGIPVVTHEVGLRTFSTFFSHQHATFREIEFVPGEKLNAEEEKRLDDYLSARFLGQFTMAGIRFWPEMKALPEDLLGRIGRHLQMVAVFTNVIFDTSQVHANTVFPDMFAWLEALRAEIVHHPDTLFIIRAHPDEDRPGKASRETVASWLEESRLLGRPNVAFFGPSDYVSSYDLIGRAKLVLVYNSSIGLEASILGAPVLCAGRARYTQLPTVFFPATPEDYVRKLQGLLAMERIPVPPEYAANARVFLFHELYRASLDLGAFLQPYPAVPGMVSFSSFEPQALLSSRELGVVRSGILDGSPFVIA
jgi:hypothetical protein